MQRIAFGRLGLSVDEYYSMTLKELYLAIEGFSEREREHEEIDLHNSRIVAYYSYKGGWGGCRDDKIRNPDDLYRLPGDETQEERIKRFKAAGAHVNKRHGKQTDGKNRGRH